MVAGNRLRFLVRGPGAGVADLWPDGWILRWFGTIFVTMSLLPIVGTAFMVLVECGKRNCGNES